MPTIQLFPLHIVTQTRLKEFVTWKLIYGQYCLENKLLLNFKRSNTESMLFGTLKILNSYVSIVGTVNGLSSHIGNHVGL